jgi:hypothetical protein
MFSHSVYSILLLTHSVLLMYYCLRICIVYVTATGHNPNCSW